MKIAMAQHIPGAFSARPASRIRDVQPAARRPHAAQDGYECGPIQNCKFT